MAENSFEFLQKLEDFFSSPDFTSAIGAFLSENTQELEYKSLDEEQPMKNYDIFKKYTQVIEKQLETFMSREGLSPKEVYDACKKAHENGEASWLTCIDYLMASTEYEDFMGLAYDHYCMSSYDPNEDEEWVEEEEGGEGEGGAPEGEVDEGAPPTADQ